MCQICLIYSVLTIQVPNLVLVYCKHWLFANGTSSNCPSRSASDFLLLSIGKDQQSYHCIDQAMFYRTRVWSCKPDEAHYKRPHILSLVHIFTNTNTNTNLTTLMINVHIFCLSSPSEYSSLYQALSMDKDRVDGLEIVGKIFPDSDHIGNWIKFAVLQFFSTLSKKPLQFFATKIDKKGVDL